MDPPQRFRSDRRMSAALLMLLVAAADPTGPIAGAEAGEQVPSENRLDILAPARSGQLQCFQPDYSERKCKILASYRFGDDGKIVATIRMLMAEEGPAVMVLNTPVEVEDRAVCGTLEHLDRATFTVGGQPATESQAAGYRLLLSVAPRKGKICATWVGDGHSLVVDGSLDGVAKPDLRQRMLWVLPEEGFTVAPLAAPPAPAGG